MLFLVRSSCGILPVLNNSYNYIRTRHVKIKLYKHTTYYIQKLWKSNVKKSDTKQPSYAEVESQVSFEQMVEAHRQEAQRSVLVQVHSEESCPDLRQYCNQHGEVRGMHHYSLPPDLHFVVVEFEDSAHVHNILNVSGHINKEVVPVQSPFLWFRAPKKASQSKQDFSPQAHVEAPSTEELQNWMNAAQSLSDQLLVLHRATALNDLGSRLRFLTARQIELALAGLFPHVKALPFGSSVNGFGRATCDLDVVLLPDCEVPSDDCRLVFHAKAALMGGRPQTQRLMETLGDVCQLLLPGCSHVRRVLQARVPIIKFKHELTGIECDLSLDNDTAVHMSALLYTLGTSDPRVRPLVGAVRRWAREVGLTNPAPGRWITNFSLTLLVLFYLQQHGVLPLLGATGDVVRLPGSVKTDLAALFTGFFEFYASFDFASYAVSLSSKVEVPKPDHAPLYIVNPLERGLNVSRNVSRDETERLRVELRNAAWLLESVPLDPGTAKSWGLAALLEAPHAAAKGRNIFYIPPRRSTPSRMMDVTELFDKSTVEMQQHTEEKPSRVVKASSRQRRR
ncbi:poly(A) RNA polymerase, mitochondrial isoform X1 [Periplaneta americana]|uniref:poly(A) RNA polymerase, mitochondrial isoform X1 n=1 Tax=Periplaneta americana TaxID=6978 RepID=UPI0037E7DA2F